MTEKNVKCSQCTSDTIDKLLSNTDETLTWCKCEKCNKWIHAICDEMSKEEVEMTSEYYCKKCRDKGYKIKKVTENTEITVNESNQTAKYVSEKPKDKNQGEIVTQNNEKDEDDNEIIPNSQPIDPAKLKIPNENLFNHKKSPEKDKTDALQHRKKAQILKEYKKLEAKIKERDEKFKEKVEKIELLNQEIQKMKEEQTP